MVQVFNLVTRCKRPQRVCFAVLVQRRGAVHLGRPSKRFHWNTLEVLDTFNVKVKSVEIKGMTGGESAEPETIDPEVLKRGEQMGFVTPVVHALTDGH